MTARLLTPSNAHEARAGASVAEVVDPTTRVLIQGIAWTRWLGLSAALVVLVIERADLSRPAVGAIAFAGMLLVTATISVLNRRDSRWSLHPALLMLQVCGAVAAMWTDGWAFDGDHALGVTALATIWGLAAAAAVGISAGPVLGAFTGALLVCGRLAGGAAPDVQEISFPFQAAPPVSVATPLLLAVVTVLIGLGAGTLRRALRSTHGEAARRRAMAEVASALHDGVLQALTYIQRRAADPDIARIARDADVDLRAFLALPPEGGQDELATAIVTSARRAEHQLGCRLDLAIDDELRTPGPDVTAAVTGAITEAIVNAAKHADASKVTVFATSDDTGIQVSVTDDGRGFDIDAVPAGGGLDQSLRARMQYVGGKAEITSAPGHGTTVDLWAP